MIILFFNLGGYRVALSLLQEREDRKLETLLDNNEYDESELIEIRVTLNVPYQQRYTEFERQYGHIEIEGKAYTYVKSKIEGDVVIFKCIANTSKQELKGIQNDLTRANSGDMPGPAKPHSIAFGKNVLSDYDGTNQFCQPSFIKSRLIPAYVVESWHLIQVAINTPHQPPEC
jgi:hypothetical protein